jgi:hypothetical protein
MKLPMKLVLWLRPASEADEPLCERPMLEVPQIPTVVILSGAPRQHQPQQAEGRGVEGPLRCFILPCYIKAFSRELLDAPFIMHAFSGSFDSPSSRKTGLGLAQDDSGRASRWQRQLQRIVLFCLLATFAVSAPAQNAGSADNFAVPTVTFDCVWEQATPQNYTITVQSTGSAKYISRSAGKPGDADGGQEEYYALDFTMSAAGQKKVFHLAQETAYFNGDFDYKGHPVASTGKKTLAFADKARHFQTTYNHSENKSIQELTGIFQGISSTIQHGRKLQYLRRFDKLGLEAELKGMEDEAAGNFLAELQIIAPMLNTIAEDSAILNIARQRARRLLAKISPE